VETGIALIVFSVVTGAVGLYHTVKSGLSRVERDRLTWLEQENPRLRAENEAKSQRINELNEELFGALQELRRRPAER